RRHVARAEVDRAGDDLAHAAAGADRLVVDADAPGDGAALVDPLGVERIRAVCAGAVQRHGAVVRTGHGRARSEPAQNVTPRARPPPIDGCPTRGAYERRFCDDSVTKPEPAGCVRYAGATPPCANSSKIVGFS